MEDSFKDFSANGENTEDLATWERRMQKESDLDILLVS